jgi:pimeloyl-ACP methyl ester carboxylesterase
MNKITVNDIEIAYEDFNATENVNNIPLILIAGFRSTMDVWPKEMIKKLALTNKVIIFDNRGAGSTKASEKQFSIELFADDTAGLLDKLGIPRANIISWSMGTYIAQELALRYPDKVNKLFLYAGDCGGSQRIPGDPKVMEMLADTSGSLQEQFDRFLKVLLPQHWLDAHPEPWKYLPVVRDIVTPESASRQYEALINWGGSYDRLPRISCKTLIITGDEDVIIPAQNSDILKERIPNSEMILYKKGGHALLYQFTEKFTEDILRFLEN